MCAFKIKTQLTQGCRQQGDGSSLQNLQSKCIRPIPPHPAPKEASKIPPKKETPSIQPEPSSIFQRKLLDLLLVGLVRKFPPPFPQNGNAPQANATIEKSDTRKGETGENDSRLKSMTTFQLILSQHLHKTQPAIHNKTQILRLKFWEQNSDMKPPEKKMKMN
jgi:hypothetical protein